MSGTDAHTGKLYGYNGHKRFKIFKKKHLVTKFSKRQDFKFCDGGQIITVRKECGRLRWTNKRHSYVYNDVYDIDYELYPSFGLNGPVNLKIFDVKYKDC